MTLRKSLHINFGPTVLGVFVRIVLLTYKLQRFTNYLQNKNPTYFFYSLIPFIVFYRTLET